jgi:ribosomal protein S18 acetylase RimI-like enzyme
MLGRCGLRYAQFLADQDSTDAILDQVAFGLRPEVRNGIFQPREDLEPFVIGERLESCFNVFSHAATLPSDYGMVNAGVREGGSILQRIQSVPDKKRMGAPLSLTQALHSDADEIADVYLASRAEALPYLRRVHTDDEVRAWIKEVALRRGETWVARRDSAIVGFMILRGEEVEQLYVLPGHYRSGIGTTLLNMAKARRPDRLYLYTFRRNTSARAFYETQGFRIIDRSDGTRNEEKEPDLRYQWTAAATSSSPQAR